MKRAVAAALLALPAVSALPAAGGTAPPAAARPPAVHGGATLLAKLVVAPGVWRAGGRVSFTYQWLRCHRGACVRVTGATGRTYAVAKRDLGDRLRVDVTARGPGGTARARTPPTAVVAAGQAAPPANTSPPSIVGELHVSGSLHVDPGTWTGTPPPSFAYVWERCPGGIAKVVSPPCVAIAGATTASYVPGDGDVGHRLRVRVTASNAAGTATAFTPLSDLVGPAGHGGATIDDAQVAPPDRLLVEAVSITADLTVHVRVVDLQGFLVSGALVYAIVVPFGRVPTAPEAVTDATGTASIALSPGRPPLVSGNRLLLFVRARKQGDSLLAGVSSRRLVRVRVP